MESLLHQSFDIKFSSLERYENTHFLGTIPIVLSVSQFQWSETQRSVPTSSHGNWLCIAIDLREIQFCTRVSTPFMSGSSRSCPPLSSKMSAELYKAETDNDPNVVVTLVAHGHRTLHMWADPQNGSFYIPPLSQATSEHPRASGVKPKKDNRERTPDPNDPSLVKTREPALQITFDKKPKNPELGYVLGSDRELCDIFLGYSNDYISERMFAISFNRNNEVIMKSWSSHAIAVSYGSQSWKRGVFTWIFPSDQEDIFVNIGDTIMFTVVVPIHETDEATYEANCRTFMMPADSASHTSNLLSLPEPPFYLRLAQIGKGGFGAVYKARSMPDGRTVAVKRFKSKAAWTLEADVLRKLSKTPHISTSPIVINAG